MLYHSYVQLQYNLFILPLWVERNNYEYLIVFSVNTLLSSLGLPSPNQTYCSLHPHRQWSDWIQYPKPGRLLALALGCNSINFWILSLHFPCKLHWTPLSPSDAWKDMPKSFLEWVIPVTSSQWDLQTAEKLPEYCHSQFWLTAKWIYYSFRQTFTQLWRKANGLWE